MATTGVRPGVALFAVVAAFLVDSVAALWTLGAFVLFIADFALYSRHHLVAASPDEAFAALAQADTEPP